MADMKETKKNEAMELEKTEQTRNRRIYKPRVDIIELKDSIRLIADMPGVDENHTDITLDNGVLVIKGIVEPDYREGFCMECAEYGVGDYLRSFTISDAIDADKISATVKNGVLYITLPKTEPAKARKIVIKAA